MDGSAFNRLGEQMACGLVVLAAVCFAVGAVAGATIVWLIVR